MLTTRPSVRLLGAPDLDEFLAFADADPVVNVFASHRARTTNLEPRWLGGEMWGRFSGGRMIAACHVGANLVPIGGTPDDLRAFAERACGRSRSVSTVVGPQESVEVLWDAIGPVWGRPREIRWRQPHLQISGPPAVAPDPLVRRTTRADLPQLYPACVAMYTEEVGISPEAGGAGTLYRDRVAQLVSRGWSFARFEDGRLAFKAEVACATPHAAQIQGVYVPPEFRGRGLAAAGMAAVVELVRRDIAPTVSLYVNDWNATARAAYARAGFTESARFATVMF
ncbi:GNAT family N-acetyltransferase [Nocardioides sp. TRM66260-LWL]|uniref:GNAT family N-acetyltransferase n=1 Tax=Nocardioides sp. TRM66260-LWL TaxID=2874478 RepID=UPI001CC80727|nr:GNAT family N-acetyltransferase [Nocardioides sp. TRM66260-LWL]MBZ5734377.1 GNAT family N-acetyltransferase [Nocardioides sp. TRM66260-LWL]